MIKISIFLLFFLILPGKSYAAPSAAELYRVLPGKWEGIIQLDYIDDEEYVRDDQGGLCQPTEEQLSLAAKVSIKKKAVNFPNALGLKLVTAEGYGLISSSKAEVAGLETFAETFQNVPLVGDYTTIIYSFRKIKKKSGKLTSQLLVSIDERYASDHKINGSSICTFRYKGLVSRKK